MTKPEQPKPLPLPLLLVFGKPTSPNLPQASWFRIEDGQAIAATAQTLKFSVVDIATEDDRALLAGVNEGVLKDAGRMIVGSVAVEVYQRIEDHVRSRAGAPVSPTGGSAVEKEKTASEQSANSDDNAAVNVEAGKAVAAVEAKPDSAPGPTPTSIKPPAAVAPDPWDGLRIGSHVVAKCWYDGGDAVGWWGWEDHRLREEGLRDRLA